MKTIFSFTTLIVASLLLSCLPTHAETCPQLDGKSAGATAETFFAGYLKALNDGEKSAAFVAKTKLATLAFKAAFKKAMADKQLGSDPVIFAQDVPITPFKAESAKVKEDVATVVVTAKYNPKETSTINVTLVAKDGQWLVSKVAKGDACLGK